jgi:PhnB protein
MSTTENHPAFTLQPYLVFNGRCQEALDFYAQALGAKIGLIHRFKDAPDQSMCAPGSEEKIMHSSFQVGTATLMASDGQCNGVSGFEGFSLSLNLTKEADAKRFFEALAQGGSITMPLTKTFFSPAFGMVKDRFGVSWMIHLQP